MLPALDDAAVARWCRAAVDALSRHRAKLDELNVFPVPDGDTGTNMLLTAFAALETLDKGLDRAARTGVPAEPTWTLLARGAVLGARGNSGTILAQLLRGLADQLADAPPADGSALAVALGRAAESTYSAVADPEEGTFLTVARGAAAAAAAAVDTGLVELGGVVRAAADGARVSLEGTTDQLDVLRAAGVVDAGGAGFCVILDALVATVTGIEPDRPPLARRRPGHPHRPPSHRRHQHGVSDLPHEPPPGAGSEVQYLLADSDEAAVDALQTRLAELGDSLVVVGVDTSTGRQWNVHVHVHDIGAAIEAGIEAGRPYKISVTLLAPPLETAPPPGTRATIAVVPSEGLAELFAAAGVRVVSYGPDGVHEHDLVEAILDCAALEVVVLPNDPALVPIANHAARRARDAGREVGVVPTRSPVQGLAAAAVADPARLFGDDIVAMADAAAATRWAEVVIAEHEALTTAGRCQPGDVLGSAEGDVVVIGTDLAGVSCDLLDRMLSAGGEMATLVVEDDDALGDAVGHHLAVRHPTIEVVRYRGGATGIPMQIGVE